MNLNTLCKKNCIVGKEADNSDTFVAYLRPCKN